MIAFHCYRVYNIAWQHERQHKFDPYEYLINTPTSSRNYRRPLHDQEGKSRLTQENKLLHRILRRSPSIVQRRTTKTPRAFHNYSPESISYPFARRRSEGGRSRTAFAFYGLPFPTPQVLRTGTVSSYSSLAAKALVH